MQVVWKIAFKRVLLFIDLYLHLLINLFKDVHDFRNDPDSISDPNCDAHRRI